MSSGEVVTVAVKPWYKSKTVWVNVIVFILSAALVVLRAIDEGTMSTPFVVNAGYVGMAITLVNTVLRFITTQPVGK